MFEIIKNHIKYKPYRKDFCITWDVTFSIDRSGRYEVWSLLPTIIWMPWYARYREAPIFDITWFNWHIAIGEWNTVRGANAKAAEREERK